MNPTDLHQQINSISKEIFGLIASMDALDEDDNRRHTISRLIDQQEARRSSLEARFYEDVCPCNF